MSSEPAAYNPHHHPGLKFYRNALTALHDAGIPFVVGGAYAYSHYVSIARETKDFDIFIHPRDVERALGELRRRHYRTELAFPHWLAKAWSGEAFMDLIFSSGNGVVTVDDDWFTHAPEADVLGMRVRLQPVEEMIWSKAFVMERERSDAADVAHLLLKCSGSIDWDRLIARFGQQLARALRAPRALRVRLPVGAYARAGARGARALGAPRGRAHGETLPSACATARSSRASST